MKVLANKRGSVTLEAAIILPVILSLLFSLVFIIKIVHTHVLIQHAINDAANEIATYSYLYSASGLQKIHDNAKDTLSEKGKQSEEDLELISGGWDAFLEMSGVSDTTVNAVKTTDTESLIVNLNKLKESGSNTIQTAASLKELYGRICDSPKQELISIGYLLGECGLENAKSYFIQPVASYFIAKNLETSEQDADARLRRMSVVNGLDGLDLSDTTIFSDKKTVDIIVKYKMELALPVNILPEIWIIQRSTVRAWLDGDGNRWGEMDENQEDNSSADSDSEATTDNSEENGSTADADDDSDDTDTGKTVWDLEQKTRGRILQEEQGRNLPDKFPTIDKLQSGTVYTINSIDTTDIYYQKPRNIKSKIIRFIDELNEFTEGSYKGTKVKQSDYSAKTVIIIVPKDSITAVNSRIYKECREYAQSLNIDFVLIEHTQKKTEE